MHAEDMDLSSYPVKVTQSPQGTRYQKPTAATNVWRIDYTNSLGEIRHVFWKSELSSPAAEIPEYEIPKLEKQMDRPQKIVAVFFGLLWEQEEPGGQWIKPNPNDKDPRANKFYEGDYTRQYMEVWRKNAYSGDNFDTLKLTRSWSKEQELREEQFKKDKEIALLREQLKARDANEAKLLEKLKTKSGK